MSQQKKDRPSIDLEFLTGLAQLLSKADINEIEIKDEGLKVRVSRGFAPVAAPQTVATAVPAPVASPTTQTSSSTASASDDKPPATGGNGSGSAGVPSPMVGTAYLASAPGAEPYVRVGDKISKGQTILIIEAMKTMNQIPAPREGIVAAICVEDGQPVEFGEVLLKLD